MTTTIAAPIAQLLRSGALISLSRSVDDISALASADTRTTHPDKYRLPLARFEQACALLDALAWHDREQPVTLDGGEHRRAIGEASRLAIDHEPASPEDRDILRALLAGDDSRLPVVTPPDPRRKVQMQRKVVMHLLLGDPDDEQQIWSREEIHESLGSPVDDVLTVLMDEGVITFTDYNEPGEEIAASRCTRHLLNLCLLAI